MWLHGNQFSKVFIFTDQTFINHFDINQQSSAMDSIQDISFWDFQPSEIKEMTWEYKLKIEQQVLERTTVHANGQAMHM